MNVADGCNRVVNATTTRQFHHLLDRITATTIDEISRAKFPGVFKFVVKQVDRDDLPSATQHCPLDGVKTNPATTDNSHGGSGFDPGSIDHRSHASHYRTTG